MSEKSAIEWTQATWNPLAGCTHVSEGCDACYAAKLTSGRLRGRPEYKGLAKDGKFTGEIRLLPDRLGEPLHWRKPRLVFVNSMSDLFHKSVPDEFIRQVFAVMGKAPRHTFQVLTKRPARMARLLSTGLVGQWLARQNPLPNVWLGTSVETQKWADVRIPHLLKTPAAVRFLSCEPLLGPLDPTALLDGRLDALRGDAKTRDGEVYAGGHGVDWVIVGGESGGPEDRALVDCRTHWYGRNAGYRWECRPKEEALTWVQSLRDQCAEASVPFFFKQWGGRTAKSGGRLLDGRTWDEMPI